jgi:hypothetical protein
MKANKLEQAVIQRMLADQKVSPLRRQVDFDAVKVRNREFASLGFLTEFECSDELKLFAADVSLRWGKVGARLVPANVDTGYLVYVDDGFLVGIEGHTYGAEWPAQMDEFSLYELRNGLKLSRART